ncbi:hypothetical protein [Clostridium akagii]|uniref:hypothetical protein n=1 Tax=Clostridium akagii TaxID=91623 RepID=UPI00047AFAF8|nr:hypothetical protein [Clostridium akagii]
MKKINLSILLLSLLIIPSLMIYVMHYYIFRDSMYLLKEFLSQLAFLPIYYIFSTIIIDNIMVSRDKTKLKKSINMTIGVFFSEFGNDFIKICSKYDTKFNDYSTNFRINAQWENYQYSKAYKFINNFQFCIDMYKDDVSILSEFLLNRRSCLIGLLENNNLVEHDTFTDLLLAIFHMCEEFKYRDAANLSTKDYEHLAVDTERAYVLISKEWLNYSKHLKSEYPHLYALSESFNPFCSIDEI